MISEGSYIEVDMDFLFMAIDKIMGIVFSLRMLIIIYIILILMCNDYCMQ